MVSNLSTLPERFADETELEEFMTVPSAALYDDLKHLDGDIMVLGVGGKMGPTLARLAKRAAPSKRVIGVARFSDPLLRQKLADWGIETLVCDLLDRNAVAELEPVANVVFMAGRKFGSRGAEELTWAMNVLVPGIVAEHFKHSRIVAFSTACIYPYVDVNSGGARESDPPLAPSGEYANSCIGRERVFQYYSKRFDTPGRLIRLSYAIDMRYGVLHDIAVKIKRGEAVAISNSHVNVVWQGDANSQALRALLHCTTPSAALNVSGPEVASVRALALQLGERLGREPRFSGEPTGAAWLVNTSESARLFGYPQVPLARLVDWTADWVQREMPTLGKPTHFENRDGQY